MRIYLIRHGRTAGNTARRLQVPETPLDDVGLEQARRLGERLRGSEVRHVLSSDLARARMTAERVSDACRVPIDLEPLLQERNFGDARGMLYHEADDDVFGPHYAPPNGETWGVFHTRAARAWRRVLEVGQRVEGDLAVVTHGLLYQHWLAAHFELPAPWGDARPSKQRPVPRIANTAVTIVEPRPAESEASTSSWRATLIGCVEHLE